MGPSFGNHVGCLRPGFSCGLCPVEQGVHLLLVAHVTLVVDLEHVLGTHVLILYLMNHASEVLLLEVVVECRVLLAVTLGVEFAIVVFVVAAVILVVFRGVSGIGSLVGVEVLGGYGPFTQAVY